MTVRVELIKTLETARVTSKAVDPSARAFASGHTAGLEDALRLIDKALYEEAATKIKAASQAKTLQ